MVGNLPHAVKGQQLRFVGDWVLHPRHSWQLKATAFEEVVPRSPQAVAAYLASTIDGELSPAQLGKYRSSPSTHASVVCASLYLAILLPRPLQQRDTLLTTLHVLQEWVMPQRQSWWTPLGRGCSA